MAFAATNDENVLVLSQNHSAEAPQQSEQQSELQNEQRNEQLTFNVNPNPREAQSKMLAGKTSTLEEQQRRRKATLTSRSSNALPVEPAPGKSLGGRRLQLNSARSLETSQQCPSTSGGQQKQMFSLKQLALNSRNLTRKRSSLAVEAVKSTSSVRGKSLARLFNDGQSNSSSCSENSNNSEAQEKPSTPSATAERKRPPEQVDPEVGQSELEAEEQSEAEDYDSEGELDDDDDEDEDDSEEGENSEDHGDEELSPGEKLGWRKSGRQRRRRRRRSHLSGGRRASCCTCEPLINRIDPDGQPVTDVDLVSYKDLCQMELRTGHQHHHHLKLEPANIQSHHLHLPGTGGVNLRRSSLQEESGAYYQLCTSSEEQQIRQRYTWHPPSLKQLILVEAFFAHFPRRKVPLVAQQDTETEVIASGQQVSGGKTGAQHPAASSYRDEQISFQLPRQDISLDYCSYPMNEQSRAAYTSFVDKRNSQALDVANVVQVKPNFGATTLQVTPPVRASHSGYQTPAIQFQTPDRQHQQQHHHHQRKASTVSQSAVALLALKQSQQDQQLSQHLSSGGSGAQRCRRCLVRFEERQLAVMAPNFIIGSALYRPGVNIPVDSTRSPALQQASAVLGRKETAPPANAALFHPTCFTCSTCKEFLVDLVYCLRDNKLFCLRHYGESLRPRCNWCQELIFSDEYLKAMNENFHVDHFLCRHCDSNLAGQRYVLKEEKPFCIQCYEGNFANSCEVCQKPIGIDSRDLSYKDRHWHDTCFVCNKCEQSLIDKPFGSKADKVYCADCYDVTFATRCDGCQNPFRAGSKKMEYRGRQWHDSCFCCIVCQNTIGSNSFIPKNDEIYCIKCYEDKYATKCTKCKQVIASGGVTFRNEPWHRDCFNCCNCDKSLAGQRFTTRDVANETVKDTNKTNQPHNAYCIDCYGELFAKKCYACSQAITGLGGTRFVTFEERSWHNDCFICNDCNTSLVGKGFITDGPETILCSECARAKLR